MGAKKKKSSGGTGTGTEKVGAREGAREGMEEADKSVEEEVSTTGGDGDGDGDDDDDGEDDDDDDVVIVAKPKSSLDDATLIDVLFSQSADNCIYPQKSKESLKSRLVSIKGKAISKIIATDLQTFASRVNMKGIRKKNKEELCKAILIA